MNDIYYSITISVIEPTSVDLNVDGTTDQCSRGDDINFQFTGFGLTGTVCYSLLLKILIFTS